MTRAHGIRYGKIDIEIKCFLFSFLLWLRAADNNITRYHYQDGDVNAIDISILRDASNGTTLRGPPSNLTTWASITTLIVPSVSTHNAQ